MIDLDCIHFQTSYVLLYIVVTLQLIVFLVSLQIYCSMDSDKCKAQIDELFFVVILACHLEICYGLKIVIHYFSMKL